MVTKDLPTRLPSAILCSLVITVTRNYQSKPQFTLVISSKKDRSYSSEILQIF